MSKIMNAVNGNTVAIYVISKNDVEVKIGVSKNVSTRALGLQTSNSSELNVFWAVRLERSEAYKVEKVIHKRLRKTISHLRGEWYAMAPETAVSFVSGVISEFGFKTIVDLNFGMERGCIT
jgi:hypothetical protein